MCYSISCFFCSISFGHLENVPLVLGNTIGIIIVSILLVLLKNCYNVLPCTVSLCTCVSTFIRKIPQNRVAGSKCMYIIDVAIKLSKKVCSPLIGSWSSISLYYL